MKFPDRCTHWAGQDDPVATYQMGIYRAAMPFVRNRRVAIDCGAHVGIFTKRMEADFEDVYSFEPMPDNFRCLAANTTKARLFNCLLWDRPARLGMKLEDHPNSGAPEIVPGVTGNYPAMSLDSFCIPNVDLIKLDVQGAEDWVLLGAKNTLATNPVVIIEMKGDVADVVRTLEEYGYQRAVQIRYDEVWVKE